MTISRMMSIKRGLIIPESEVFCKSCDCQKNIINEMRLARKSHRYPEMQKHIISLFNDFMDLVTKYEIKMLEVLDLPGIEETRRFEKAKSLEGFTYNTAKDFALVQIISQWLDDIVGVGFDPNSLYGRAQVNAFAIGLTRTLMNLSARAPEGFEPLRTSAVQVTAENVYLKQVILEGGQRIKTALAIENMGIVRAELQHMASMGLGPREVARRLHKITGEGKAWYWLRLARTESVFAYESAFTALAHEEEFNFEEWSAGKEPCYICDALDGQTWRVNEGPRPGYDTHSNCQCIRMLLYFTDGPVNRKWDRESPYEVRPTEDEVATWRGTRLNPLTG